MLDGWDDKQRGAEYGGLAVNNYVLPLVPNSLLNVPVESGQHQPRQEVCARTPKTGALRTLDALASNRTDYFDYGSGFGDVGFFPPSAMNSAMRSSSTDSLRGDLVIGERRVTLQVGHCLRAGPSELVNAGVNSPHPSP